MKKKKKRVHLYNDGGPVEGQPVEGDTKTLSDKIGIGTSIASGVSGIMSSAVNLANAGQVKAQELDNAVDVTLGQQYNSSNTLDDLLNQSNYSLMGKVSYKDFMNSAGSNAMAALNSGISGVSAGSAAGPWGAVTGAGAGLLGGIFGAIGQRRKAKKLAAEYNDRIKAANAAATNNYNTALQNAEDNMFNQNMASYYSQGGPLTMRYTGAMSPFGNTFDKGGKIHIKPSKRGTFTAAAKKHGKSVQAFASQVLANKENYSPAMVKKANFARNFGGRKKANGGFLDNVYGGVFSNGVTSVNEGGTHEENPMEGVQMGMDAQGVPNLVEEGEVIFNDYVFSDRMKVPNNIRERLGLSKKDKNLTFAKAAKKLSKESEERPNDPISKNGLEHSLGILSYIQEDERLKKQMRNPEFRQQVMNQLAAQEQQYAHGGKLGLKYEGDRDVPQYLRRPDSLYDWSGIDTMFDDWSFDPSNLKGNLPYTRGSNTNIAAGSDPARHNAFTDYALSLPDTHPYWTTLSSKTGKDIPYLRNSYQSLRNDGKLGYVSLDPQVASDIPNLYPIDERPSTWMPQLISERDNIEIPLRASSATIKEAEKEVEKEVEEGGDRGYPTWLRYAPVVGAAIGLGQNIFSKPDYSSADAVLNATNEAGSYTPVEFNPLGDYLTYRPFDRNYYINKLNAHSGATRRAIINTSNGNRASAIAGLLAADYNAQGKLGDLARQAEEYNLDQRERVATFNRDTNQFNSDMGLKAAVANQDAASKARTLRLSGIAQAMQMRDDIDERRASSMSANLTNLFDSLGNIGIDAMNRADRDMLIRAGVFGTLSEKPQGWSNKRWEDYKKAISGEEYSRGGKLKKRRGGLTY